MHSKRQENRANRLCYIFGSIIGRDGTHWRPHAPHRCPRPSALNAPLMKEGRVDLTLSSRSISTAPRSTVPPVPSIRRSLFPGLGGGSDSFRLPVCNSREAGCDITLTQSRFDNRAGIDYLLLIERTFGNVRKSMFCPSDLCVAGGIEHVLS